MARLYPNQPVGSVSPENAEMFQALRQIPGSDTHIWMALQGDAHWRPDWMILYENRVCYLLVVSDLSLQGDWLASGKYSGLGVDEASQLTRFFHNLSTDSPIPPVFGVVVFPNISQEDLDRLEEKSPNPDVALWGREMLSGPVLEEALQKTEVTMPFPIHWRDLLRQKICPETRIPREMTVAPSRSARRDLGPRHTRQLLDLDQEYLVKSDLQLNRETRDVVVSHKVRLVTGVAGSGKSLVLLYRAMLQSRLDPAAKILTVTHNRPLSFELRLRQEKIQKGSSIKWQTFYQWCGSLFHNESATIVDSNKLLWLNELRPQYASLNPVPSEFLTTEIDWIREQGFDDEEDYLTASRRGRKRPLTYEQRQNILNLLADYRTKLAREKKTDWPEIIETFWAALKSGQIPRPAYDHILVDEAQFFAPLWFKIILFCREPLRGTLFLVADPTQGFLRQRTSWRDCGIEVRGHSVRLLKGYRNCRQILEFAANFYRRRLPDLDADNNLPEDADLAGLPAGMAPQFIEVDQRQDESTCVANEILQALKLGQNPANFLVLFRSRSAVTDFVEKMNLGYQSEIAWDSKLPHQPHPMVRVATLNSGTGLESQAVFICGIDSLLSDEGKREIDSSETEELVRNNTRQIYMALTRASRQVYIIYRHPATRTALEGG